NATSLVEAIYAIIEATHQAGIASKEASDCVEIILKRCLQFLVIDTQRAILLGSNAKIRQQPHSIAATSRNQLILNAGKNAADTGVTDQPTGQWRTVFANLGHLGQRIGCLDQVVVSIDEFLDVGGNTLLILGNRNRNTLVLVGRNQIQCH